MKTLEQAQSEALTYTIERIKFWEQVEKKGKLPNPRIPLSKKDLKWLSGREAAEQPLSGLAARKLKALNRDLLNLKKKLGKDPNQCQTNSLK